jgi:fimbrial chaperone protein
MVGVTILPVVRPKAKPPMWMLASVGLLCLAAVPTQAANYEIVPIRVDFGAGQATTTVTLRNLSDTPSSVQVRAYAWTQAGDRDDLAPTADIVLSPPIFTVPAGQSQTVRLLLRNRTPAPDRAYRLLFDELPPAGQPGQIQMAMRVSIPVLLDPPPGPRPQVQWRAVREPAGHVALVVSNPGHRFVRVGDVAGQVVGGRAVALRPVGDNPYVLPGAERRWVMQGSVPAGGVMQLTATTQAGPMEQTIQLPP